MYYSGESPAVPTPTRQRNLPVDLEDRASNRFILDELSVDRINVNWGDIPETERSRSSISYDKDDIAIAV